ncbi:MAG: hypothetical protein A3I44_02650 [Candidatus Sungbacteria bacterium RIFCSPLOWO2_02_FULL_51_17]|uniref:Uncharacterized protein n=1 Tax=Candidatus Sungbacteria bacterium RIFCSPHIGHO2_02_FULL_51_29 TaxID=1802273 RepID=A0A1G2KVT8_9BACT|nr:MAG: hypothetical protein A2676_02265 [Candidatus Sungbacteria bacterium RIFCSPHIGHO2_01_FULL_51_22]OHA03557.1 MAG: hypothetical protein A3C16_04705 [Candidatus Sungbacteria bacterium RIFCSPHIGHO2_02_FULL_51_29]OHA10800.1 MAG: hypothetical protein A3I44_02650 [Candidatus Sungbacteria bacterium RIFCSPLOWO2_02_FULL_51_17]
MVACVCQGSFQNVKPPNMMAVFLWFFLWSAPYFFKIETAHFDIMLLAPFPGKLIAEDLVCCLVYDSAAKVLGQYILLC